MERKKYCRTCLLVEGENTDPDYVSRLFRTEADRKERRDGVNVLTGLWRRCIGARARATTDAREQLEYWCAFLQERQDGVGELRERGSQVTIECYIGDPVVFFDLPADIMQQLGQMNVPIKFSIYDPMHPDLQPKDLNRNFLVRNVERSDDIVQYLTEQLHESRIARNIRAKLDAAKGSFFAILPEGLEPQQVRHWGDSVPEVGYPQNPRLILFSIIRRFLCASDRRVLGQEPDRPPEWPADYSMTNFVRYQEELGWELRGPSVTESEIEASLRCVSSLPYVLYFYRSDSPRRNTLDDQAVNEISSTLLGLAVGALNEKSFLIWWRTDLMPFPGSDIAATV